jgi:hypothetical protein
MPLYWLAALEWSKVTEKLPPQFLLKTGLFLLVVFMIVVVVKIFQSSNKILLSIILCAAMGILFFSWIYNRNEPEFLTPIIEPLAQFFPSKGYEKKDVSDLDNQKKAGNKPKPSRP